MERKEVSLITEDLSMSDIISSKGTSSTKVVSLTNNISFKDVLKKNLASDESFIQQVYFSGKKVLMQKQYYESILVVDDAMHDSKELSKG